MEQHRAPGTASGPPGPSPTSADGPAERRSAGQVALRAFLVAIVLGIVVMWIYVFSGAAKAPPPDALDDSSITQRGEAICKPVLDQLKALPQAGETPEPGARADVVTRSDVLLAGMLDQLGAVQPTSERDRRIYGEWLADWRTYLANREDYANRLRSDRNARLFVAQKGAKQITEPIDGFATSNGMPSCATPGDIF